MRVSLVVFLSLTLQAIFGQANTGELRLSVVDAAASGVEVSVTLTSQANQIQRTYLTDERGKLTIEHLPFGAYRLEVKHEQFSPAAIRVEIRSAVPVNEKVTLTVAPLQTAVVVTDEQTLLDPHATSNSKRIGSETLEHRTSSPPGRSIIDLVNDQPGWLLEANGILHPRGSEYQTQYVVDGVPLTENRSPAFAPEMEADDVQSMAVLTGGYPAEYGRKLGGVVEVTTASNAARGFHGKAAVSGGSFDTLQTYLDGQYGWRKNTFTVSADTSRTGRYLDPPVLQNYTNQGTGASFSAHYERDLSDRDRVGAIVRREQSRLEVPNEQVQQDAGQRQDRTSTETAGEFSYQHVFSPSIIADLHGFVRDVSAALWSNPYSTPISASQDRGFRETYLKGAVSVHHGVHELKAGIEGDFGSVREQFAYTITHPAQFDPDTPPQFQFAGRAQDREQSLFVQDLMRLGHWTISAGVRWDHYRLLVDESAVSPRLAAAWYWPRADLILRASYDRVFQTPAFENLLLASSPAVDTLNDNVLRLPVKPSLGNFYEVGFSKGIFGKIRIDGSVFARQENNFADDDLLLNTGVSFPIAFREGRIHGAEIKLEIPRLGRLSGFVSYSNMIGYGYLPVTGGLFLGDEAAGVLTAANKFAITQDQRNTARARFRYDVLKHAWVAAGASYGSGLPVEFAGTREDALSQYGEQIVDRVNFQRGRVRPSFSLDLSAGIQIWDAGERALRLQGDLTNVTDRLNVIDFAGLFSGTAIAPPRAAMVRLEARF